MPELKMGASKSICKIYVIDPTLRVEYEKRVAAHNTKLEHTSHPDSGFNILQPGERILCNEHAFSNKLPLGVMAAAYDIESSKHVAYYLFPRSSISKTRMRMCNSVGIIDSGYRGELTAMVDLVGGNDIENGIENGNDVKIHVKDRYFQICMGDLSPFYVELVDKMDDLGITDRGTGGFGSTGR